MIRRRLRHGACTTGRGRQNARRNKPPVGYFLPAFLTFLAASLTFSPASFRLPATSPRLPAASRDRFPVTFPACFLTLPLAFSPEFLALSAVLISASFPHRDDRCSKFQRAAGCGGISSQLRLSCWLRSSGADARPISGQSAATECQ